MSDYRNEARSDAGNTVTEFADNILEQLLDSGEASDDLLNDYPNGDAWHHESHTDKYYNLTEAAELLDELSDYEETDSGLWDSLAPREAICCQAAYTYANAVYAAWRELIKEINDRAEDIIDDYDDKIADAEKREWDEDATDEEIEENPDVATLEEEKEEALQAMIKEVADNA